MMGGRQRRETLKSQRSDVARARVGVLALTHVTSTLGDEVRLDPHLFNKKGRRSRAFGEVAGRLRCGGNHA